MLRVETCLLLRESVDLRWSMTLGSADVSVHGVLAGTQLRIP